MPDALLDRRCFNRNRVTILKIRVVSEGGHGEPPLPTDRCYPVTIAIGATIEPVAPMNLSGVQTKVEIQASASESAFK
jgi:hypothetical protein